MGLTSAYATNLCSTEISVISRLYVVPQFKDENVLRTLYLEKRLSVRQIAHQLSCSRQSVKKFLTLHQVELRPEDKRKHGPPGYGEKWKNHKVVAHSRERDTIEKMIRLRSEGLSYEKIASVLKAMSVPTKRRGERWYGNSVYRILKRDSERRE